MRIEHRAMMAAWCHELNGVRFVSGLEQVWVMPSPDGHRLAFMPAEWDEERREKAFEALLMEFWCARYGLPEARSRMLAYLRGDHVA